MSTTSEDREANTESFDIPTDLDITAPTAENTESGSPDENSDQKPLPPSYPPRKSIELEKINETDRENETLDESNILSSNAPVPSDQEPGLENNEGTESDEGDNQADVIVDAEVHLEKAQPLSDQDQGPTNTINTLPEIAQKNAGMTDIDVDRYQGPLREATPSGHVGFDSLPDQVVNKATGAGFCFNILCIGETGIGKSTLMNTLFNTSFDDDPRPHDLPGVRLRANSYELQETNVRLKLTLVDTVGFGDQINKDQSYKPIVDYIDQQFEAYLQEELKVKRNLYNYSDSRIHACLYFIAPTGHSLKSLDLVTMKALVEKVNIIPIIAKSDTISKEELAKFKLKIMSELLGAGIQTYQFPTDDPSISALNSKMNGMLPFAVVGSMDEVKVGNRMVRARQYPWGTVQVENESHCDFNHLREMLLRVNLEDLRSSTHTKHYELYRRNKLIEMGFNDDTQSTNGGFNLQEVYEHKREEHLRNMQDKEDEMRQTFVARVKEKENELKEAEHLLHEKFESLRKRHAEDKKRLEERRQTLEDEMSTFYARKQQLETQMAANKPKPKRP